jgi:predicted nucleic-acid-binding Zn-ribbon protein
VPDKQLCPKCKAEMQWQPYTMALAGFIDPKRRDTPADPVITQHRATAVRVLACPNCHYVELYLDIP